MTGNQSSVVIVGDGDVDSAELARLATPAGATGAHATSPPARPLVLAADGGAARCRGAGIQPDIVIGDLDSLAPEERTRLEALGVEFRVTDRAKDESDMELCITAALDAGATRITILGALGIERPEHGVANLLLLADPRLDGLDVAIVGHGSVIRRIGTEAGPGRIGITGRPGDLVSLFPLGTAVSGVTTAGLRFPLQGETLRLGPSRGLSNELTGNEARVSTETGCLLVVQTPAQDERAALPGSGHEGKPA